MGTMVAIEIADPLPPATLGGLAEDFFAWMREVDARFSTYRDDSEVNRVERGELRPADGTPHLRAVLSTCAELWRTTDAYFDVYATGRLDPSGYVKGWAAEIASARLAAAGSTNHFINAGGDVRVRGHYAPGRPWSIPLRHPWDPDGAFLVLTGTDLAVATSGTYARGFHVINPRTGHPARDLRSVTVAGPDLGLADAYATAAVAMGRPGLRWLAELPGYEIAVVTEDGEGFTSPGLPVAPADVVAAATPPSP
ncbi:FAD:protein FMN transferase [Dactylosporangium sp. McL0621]|uniref:FAD:protein FMN transferase n=1 Tax=Dactylosporangium sp. McL0621 TaxID=3415678 RepID=UPI003CF17969